MKVLSLDLGGTNIKSGIIENSGRIINFFKYPVFKNARSEKGLVKKLTEIIFKLSNGKNIKGIGLGVPGFIDFKSDLIIASPNFPEWSNFKLRKILENTLKLPVVLENDANAFTIGEGWIGAGMEFKSFIGITLGTGVGGGIILDGKIWHGSQGSAGEIGHVTVEPDGLKCNCGNNGCLEIYASANAVARDGRGLLKKAGIKVPESNIALEIYRQARKGNKEAIEIFSNVGYYLGIAIADIANLLNIDGVVIGGGMSGAWEFIYPAIKREISFRVNTLARKKLKILRGKLGDRAALLGMAKVAFDNV